MLAQDHGLKENLLDLLQYMCSSGPEGQWKAVTQAELRAVLGCGQEAAAEADFVSHWQDLALLHLQELQKFRTAARPSKTHPGM